ncbi:MULTISPECIES: DnaB-like helicase N-terminal domain-containing protein [Rhodococcus]|uniref:DnaB-like helicase N-terminal domain-containing protein n=1 Tax=Rhodococcus TaxID=1827 RepID=UPI001980399D|nr:DnaB-like helicase N-terminal domain-containing protein [Rhodococcus sp. PSBB049]QSE72254.1 DNA helicase [Rhodococcus sp. PSBB049]
MTVTDQTDLDRYLSADEFAPPDADTETLLLCALLFATRAAAADIVDLLTTDDFHQPLHAELFDAIAALMNTGQPHDPAMVLAHLERHGRLAGHHGRRLAYALTTATTAGADPTASPYYAHAVISAAYRRSFRTAGATITEAAETLPEAAETLPEADLFDHMVAIGRVQRAAARRLDRVRARLGGAPTVGATT